MRVARWMSAITALCATLAIAGPAAAQHTRSHSYHRETTVRTVAAEPSRDWARIRFGISGHGGGLVNGPEIGMGGLSARLGIQIGDYLAFYYQPMGLVGAFTARPDGSAAAGLMFNAAMMDVTLGNMLSLALGPSLDFIWGCADTVQSESVCASSEGFAGVDARVALNIGAFGNMTRQGVTLSVDVHPTFFDEDSVGMTVLGGVGFESF